MGYPPKSGTWPGYVNPRDQQRGEAVSNAIPGKDTTALWYCSSARRAGATFRQLQQMILNWDGAGKLFIEVTCQEIQELKAKNEALAKERDELKRVLAFQQSKVKKLEEDNHWIAEQRDELQKEDQ